MEKKKNQVECLQCKKRFIYLESEFRPFCSERCKQVDLGHWLHEGYAISSEESLDEEDLDKIEREEIKKDS